MKPVTISSGIRAESPADGTGSGRCVIRTGGGVAVFALALLARLAFQACLVGMNAPPRDDAGLYDSIARRVSLGGVYIDDEGYRSRRPPGFALLLSGVYRVAGPSWPAARVVQAILGSLTCCVVLALGAAWRGPRFGLTAGVVCALLPITVYWSGYLLSEPLCALGTSLSTWALVSTRHDGRWAVGWGMACGLATLTRPNMILLLPLGIAWLLAIGGRRAWKRAATAVAVFVVALLPWTIRNSIVHHRLVPVSTMGGMVLWQANNPAILEDEQWIGRVLEGDPALREPPPRLPEADEDRMFFRRAIDFMTHHVSDMPRLVLAKMKRLWNPLPRLDSPGETLIARLVLAPLLLLFLAGLIAGIFRRDPWFPALLVPVLAVTITAAVYWGDGRIRSPADPFILLIAIDGFRSLTGLRSRATGQAVSR